MKNKLLIFLVLCITGAGCASRTNEPVETIAAPRATNSPITRSPTAKPSPSATSPSTTPSSTSPPPVVLQSATSQVEVIESKLAQANSEDWSIIPVPDIYIWDIKSCPDGAIWFATDQGVWRYDGKAWRVFTVQDGLPSDSFFSGFACNSQGDIVVSSCFGGGIYRLNGERWDEFTTETPPIIQGVCGDGLHLQDDGKFWMGVMNPEMGYSPGLGVIHFDGDNWHIYYPVEFDLEDITMEAVDIPFTNAVKILPDPDEGLWLLTEAGLTSYDGDTWRSYFYDDITRVTPTPDDAVHKKSGLWGLVVTTDGMVWTGIDGGAARWDGSSWVKYNISWPDSEGYLFPVVAGQDGSVWFSADSLFHFDGNTWWEYQWPPEIENGYFRLGTIGPDDALWLTSYLGFIVRYLPGGEPISTEIPILIPSSVP